MNKKEKCEVCLKISDELYLTDEEFIILTELGQQFKTNILHNTFIALLTVEGMIEPICGKNGYMLPHRDDKYKIFDENYNIIKKALMPETIILKSSEELYHLLRNKII